MSHPTEAKLPWKQRLRHELLEYWLTVLYLALYFGVFTTYRRWILAQHQIDYLNYGVAIVEALVLGKVILLGDLLRLGRGMEERPLLVTTFVRVVMFTGWVWVFKIAEHTLGGIFQGEGALAGLKELVGKGRYELLASGLVVFFTFIPFFAFRELNRSLGKGIIWDLFFHRRSRGRTAASPTVSSS